RERRENRAGQHREVPEPREARPEDGAREARGRHEIAEAHDEERRQHEGLDDAVERHGLVVRGGRRGHDALARQQLKETEEAPDGEEPEGDPEVREGEAPRRGAPDRGRRVHGRTTFTRPHMDWWPGPQYSLQYSGTVTLPSALTIPTFATDSKEIVVWTSETYPGTTCVPMLVPATCRPCSTSALAARTTSGVPAGTVNSCGCTE